MKVSPQYIRSLCRHSRAAGILLFSLVLWSHRLFPGLALDETGTALLVAGSAADVIRFVWDTYHQGPVYYLLVWCLTQLLGHSELVLRAASVVSVWAAALLLFRLVARLVNKEVAFFSVVIFVSLDPVVEAATSARPYGMALALYLAATLCLVQWLTTRRAGTMLLYLLSGVLCVYSQYLFALGFLIHVVFFLLHNRTRRVPVYQLLLALILLSPFVVPFVRHSRLLLARSDFFSYSLLPSFSDIFFTWFPPALWLLAAALFCLLRLQRDRLQLPDLTPSAILMIFCWYLLPPVLNASLSYFSGASLLVPRYCLYMVPAIAFAGGLAMNLSSQSRTRSLTCFAFALLVLVVELSTGLRQAEGWDRSAEIINREVSGACPVLLYSGYKESLDIDWLEHPVKGEVFFAPLRYYPVSQPVVIVPLTLDIPVLAQYFRSHTESILQQTSCVWLLFREGYMGDERRSYTPAPFQVWDELKGQGFALRQQHRFGLEVLQRFER